MTLTSRASGAAREQQPRRRRVAEGQREVQRSVPPGSEKGVRLAQKMQVGSRIPAVMQLETAEVGPTSGPTCFSLAGRVPDVRAGVEQHTGDLRVAPHRRHAERGVLERDRR
jgi:hypothetical protein